MPRKTVRCLNPKCLHRMPWRDGVPAPKSCPLCGYPGSHEEAKRQLETARAMREARRESNYQAMRAHLLSQLPIWKQKAIRWHLWPTINTTRHSWGGRKGVPVQFCQACNVVERQDGLNGPCRGK